MFQVLLAAFGWVMRYLLGKQALTWIIGSVLVYGVLLLLDFLISLLPTWFNAQDVSSLFNVLTPGMWYFFDYFMVGTGITMSLSALVARFLIRRIPFLN